MTALSANPTTQDLLLPNRFRLDLKRAPNVNYWIQKVSIPGFSISSPDQPNPFVKIPKSGEHIEYEQLGITFLIQNDFANYLELYAWLRSLGKPESFEEYAKLLIPPPILDEGVTSEVSVFILNGQQQAKYQFIFHDAFPNAISGFEMTSGDSGLERVECHVAFEYSYFDILPIK